ncbi:MAG: hypothetical protein CM1200mP27_02900 [Chloroflexota bacterium]|nr:MAG: hypothetical protein CM1200mP27_02900 [Chloroflexota bacterium]
MLSPPTGFQGSHGQEKKEQGDADKIHDVRRVYHAPCEIVKMSTDTDFSDDLATLFRQLNRMPDRQRTMPAVCP